MSKILKNVTGGIITVADTGVSIPALSQYTIPPQDYLLWAASSNVVGYIGASQLVVNDGSVDLSISRGIDLIKGIFPYPFTVTNPFIINLDMTTAGDEYSYTFPLGLRQFSFKARKASKLQLAYVVTESGTDFETYWPGEKFRQAYINSLTPLTIYVQASKDNEVLEIAYWT